MSKRLALLAIRLLVSLNLLYAAIFLKFAGVPGAVALFTNMSQAFHGLVAQQVFRLGSGLGVDADGDGFVNELTRADITAATVFQATLPPPGRVIPNNPDIEQAIRNGEQRFEQIGCGRCHIPALPLENKGWIYSEPNPYNPPGNLRVGDAPALTIDLSSDHLPGPRLKPEGGLVWVPAFTDFKLHDITAGPGDPNREPLDMNQPAGSSNFFAGNGKFITRKLWGVANQHSFGHHGLYTTMREAVLAHAGEALDTRLAFQLLNDYDRDSRFPIRVYIHSENQSSPAANLWSSNRITRLKLLSAFVRHRSQPTVRGDENHLLRHGGRIFRASFGELGRGGEMAYRIRFTASDTAYFPCVSDCHTRCQFSRFKTTLRDYLLMIYPGYAFNSAESRFFQQQVAKTG